MEKIKNTSPDFKNNTKNIKSGLRTKSAFTLVELIVVITILAILGTIAFISLQGYSRDARDATRTADLGNIKTSLELFSLKTGKYPSPDSYSTITYSGGTENVWFQGNVGDIVTTNLKSLNEKPLDPLTNTPYTYSVTNSYKEYEVLALYEGSVAYNPIINQTNAAVSSLTPKIVGNYNGVFVKTTNYIIPTPSIVTAEPLTGGILILNSTNINSQVITNGINIPSNTIIPTQTGALNINLSVYTGSINKLSTNIDKINVIKLIQEAYTGTTLSINNEYLYILNQVTNKNKINLANVIILDGLKQNIVPKSTINCIYKGEILYGTLDGTDIGLSCNDNIIICNGKGDGTIIQSCNLGSNNVGTGTLSYGKYYQWGNNGGTLSGTIVPNINLVDTIQLGYGGGVFYNNTLFIGGSGIVGSPYDWSTPQNNNLWGDVTNTNIARKGPCPIGYHIPSSLDWSFLYSAGLWGNNGIKMSNDLKMPMSGFRYWSNGTMLLQGLKGAYPSSSSSGTFISSMTFIDSNIKFNDIFDRAVGMSIRCFKN